MNFKPLFQPDHQINSLPDVVANHILRKIFSGELKQGDRLIEVELKKELKVSSIPIREAFYTLENAGILERLPRKGVRVRSISQKEISDYLEGLIELFNLAVDYSKSKWNEEKHNQLNQYFLEANEKFKEEDIFEYIIKAYQVCIYIFMVAENKAFARFYFEITYVLNAFCQTKWNHSEKLKSCHEYLEAMVNSLIASKFDQAKLEFELLAKESTTNC